ncbi:MAG: rhodanese-like domain-containing protein [Planctomycetaceae bacterium]|nr:rhodanese-like domain-containing protein [Planctomycetaceae bacterium]
MRHLLLIPAILCLLLTTASAADHTDDTPEVVKKNLKADKAVLVDVREVEEWDEGHLEAATLWQLSDINDGPTMEDLKKRFGDKNIVYLHCRSGGRALFAAEKLKDKGYDIRPLKPGYADLLKAGFKKADDEK